MKFSRNELLLSLSCIVPVAVLSFYFPEKTFTIISVLIVIALSCYFVHRIKFLMSENEYLEKENKRVKDTFVKCRASLLSRAINSDYHYPLYEPKDNDENALISAEELNRSRKLRALHGDVKIEYEYEFDGKTYISRDISIIPEKTDLQLAFKIKNEFTVLVDKNDPEQSYIRVLKKEAIKQNFIDGLLKEAPVLLVIAFVIVLNA
ncbi:hypothetical protein D3C87_378800 [compost metagenome]